MQKFGINLKSGSSPAITKYEDGFSYDFVVTYEEVIWRNGNGSYRIKVYDSFGNLKEIEDNGWTVNPVIDVPFNWSGSSINPKITDPNGKIREIHKGGYSETIFKGLSSNKDVNATFNVLREFTSYSSWCEFDLKQLEKEKNKKIEELQLEIIDLKNQVTCLLQANQCASLESKYNG